MKGISCVKEFAGDDTYMPLKDLISDTPIKGKIKILKYLKSFSSDCAAGMSLVDEITGDSLNTCVCGYEDCKYYWDDREIYHFEKYNLKLNDDFIEYVLNKN